MYGSILKMVDTPGHSSLSMGHRDRYVEFVIGDSHDRWTVHLFHDGQERVRRHNVATYGFSLSRRGLT